MARSKGGDSVSAAIAVKVKERPILFSGPMVDAILAGRKSQTRRAVKVQPEFRDVSGVFASWVFKKRATDESGLLYPNAKEDVIAICPYGHIGDRLWVRETFAIKPGTLTAVRYAADFETPKLAYRDWKPSIFMPRWASRLTLEITDVRVERLQKISGIDARAEGYPDPMSDADLMHFGGGKKCRQWYQLGWDSLNAKRGYSWDSNPWVWVVGFKKL